ncbi:MAG: aminomethyl transferase family protein [Deltaproteobacteria bacterium]|nr:aminomethyl transferase family protein [Deltaproteobacteria bacterium]
MKFQECEVKEVHSTLEEEYKTVCEGVGVLKMPWKKVLRLEGVDVADFLDRMTSNKIMSLKAQEGMHTTLLTHNGFLISDMIVLKFENHFLVIVDEMNREVTLKTFNKYIVADQVEIFDVSQDWDIFHFQGKNSSHLLKKWVKLEVLKNYNHVSFHTCHVAKVPRSRFQGFDVLVPKEKTHDVYLEVLREGAEPIGFKVFDMLRIEAGLSQYPNEVGEKTIPLELKGFEDAVHYDKQCYTGQETIAKIKYRGHVNKLVVGFILEGKQLPNHGDEIFKDDQRVGWITSTAYSLGLQKNIALGFIKYDWRETQDKLVIKTETTHISCKRVNLPFLEAHS